ncbi:DNA polymerase Y family protein [Schaalia sp. Marseille-Q2122]|uniref:DNA polymerase Y family protein n=1 Tax=Schaalia sp. Marseille-Q2122 TaxID=2736604 RepID=UPI00158D0770|nr:DNA polymerase Y family protein [Schaalia sp. Marseille-Q2122]
MTEGIRRFALWVPDWPTACLILGTPPGAPAVLVDRGRVQHTTVAARQAGVRTGMSTRTAQHLCPELVMSGADPDTEAAHFEEILRACEEEIADIAVLRPGLAWGPIGPAARWHGSEEHAAENIIDAVSQRTGVECLIGIADGTLAPLLAARSGRIIPPGESPAYLAGLSLERIPYLLPGYGHTFSPLIAALNKLGMKSVEDLRRADAPALRARFGQPMSSLLACITGADLQLPQGQRICAELTFSCAIDPPAHQVEHAVIPMRRIAQEIVDALTSRGMSAQSLTITLRSEAGQTRTRTWNGCDARDSHTIIERLRWHAQGWMSLSDLSPEDAPRGPLSGIDVIVSDFISAPESDYLWGKDANKEVVDRAITQIQALLGEEAALAVSLQGGHDPRSRTFMRPWGRGLSGSVPREGEWEGGVSDNPDTLCHPPIPAALFACAENRDAGRRLRLITPGPSPSATPGFSSSNSEALEEEPVQARPVIVTPRGVLSDTPTHITLRAQPRSGALAHWEKECPYAMSCASPLWVVRGRWWDRADHARTQRVYLRVRTEKGPDLLLVYRSGQWWVEGAYA